MRKRVFTGIAVAAAVSVVVAGLWKIAPLAIAANEPEGVVVNREINAEAHAAVDTLVEASRGHFNLKNVTLNTPPRVVEELSNGETGKALKYANLTADSVVSVVAYERLGVDSIIFLMSTNTPDGPAVFRVCCYTYKGVATLSEIGVTGEWSAMEDQLHKMDRLAAPVAMSHNPDHGEQQPPPQ